MLNQSLLVWFLLTVISALVMLFDFGRRETVRWPFNLAWLLTTAFFGILGLLAYRVSDGRSRDRSERRLPLGGARRALGPALFSATGNMTGLVLVFLLIVRFFPTSDVGPLPFILAMLLSGWLVFRTPFTAWAQGRRYWALLPRLFAIELVSTFFVLVGVTPTLLYLTANVFHSPPLDSTLHLAAILVAALAGAILVYPYTFWTVRRGWCAWPRETATPPGAPLRPVPTP